MEDHKEHLKNLSDIRSMMERSSRFISLSGLSGVFAGIYALVAAYLAYIWELNEPGSVSGLIYYLSDPDKYPPIKSINTEKIELVVKLGGGILLASLLTGFILTRRNSIKKGLPLWDKTAKRLLTNMAIPLVTGGIVCLVFMFKYFWLPPIAAITLIFYGLALVNASKYTLNDIRYLGICEIILGLIALMYPTSGLLLWAIGFGILHIIYGTVMYFKYER